MSRIFGKTSSRESDKESIFSTNQTREPEVKEQEEQTPQTEEGQSVEPTEAEEVGGQSGEEVEQETTEEKLAGKFRDRTSLVDGIANLGEKLGRKVDPGKVKNATNDELEEVYNELQKELGKTSDIDATRQENQQLKQQLEQYKQQLQQTQQQMNSINQYLQRQQMQNQQPAQNQNFNQNQQNTQQNARRNPQTGRFESQQDNQPQNQNQNGQVDPDEWLKEFYTNPVEAVRRINNMSQAQEQQVRQNMNQQEKQDLRQQQEQMRQQKQEQYRQDMAQLQRQHFNAKTKEMTEKYGDSFDNPETKQKIMQFMRTHPAYMNPRIFPDGIEIAYKAVSKSKNGNQNNEEIVNQKKAAQLPRSQGSNIRSTDNSDEAEAIKSEIFGGSGGLFR